MMDYNYVPNMLYFIKKGNIMDANYTKDEIKIRILVLAISDKEFHKAKIR